MTPPLDVLVQDFFCRRLIEQQGVSQRTIEAYRDTFRLLLAYLPGRLKKPVPALDLSDLDAPAILGFLDHLEAKRHNGPRTRNARLAAVRSFVQYAASRDPTAWPLARRVLAIPSKRYTKPLLGYLTREEMQAVLNAPDGTTRAGHRDRVLFGVMYNTGARVSEIIGLRRDDVISAPTRSLRIRGKGRKERVVPPVEADGRCAEQMAEATWPSAKWPTLPECPRPVAQSVRCRRSARRRRREGRGVQPKPPE